MGERTVGLRNRSNGNDRRRPYRPRYRRSRFVYLYFHISRNLEMTPHLPREMRRLLRGMWM
jgi:hypothetical protein